MQAYKNLQYQTFVFFLKKVARCYSKSTAVVLNHNRNFRTFARVLPLMRLFDTFMFLGFGIHAWITIVAVLTMFFPIMFEAALKLGYEPLPFLVALMISVSSCFATPIGSPTHLLVYGPGGYRFSDFFRIGLLMNIIILAANIFIVSIDYPLTPLH